MSRNQFGLNRDIPDPIKREVRQRCGFGCVICGGAVIDYEHFDPVFARVREHSAAGITLLCPGCHAKKTRNLLSDRRVREANQEPAARKQRYAYSEVEGTPLRPFIKLAGATLRNCETPIEVRGVPLIRIEDAEEVGGPYRLSASFFDASGKPSLFIRRNEWQVLSDAWDVEVVGPSVTVRTAPGEVALRLRFVVGEGIVVDRLKMYCAGYLLSGDAEVLDISVQGQAPNRFKNFIADNCKIGFSLG